MTDLHFNSKKIVMTFTRNRWKVEANIYAHKEIDKNIYNQEITYDHIYLPLSLEKCLVLIDAFVYYANPPDFEDGRFSILLQDVELGGKGLDMISMDIYQDIKKGDEKLAD